MSNDYATTLLVEHRLAELRHEADQERLARLVLRDRPRQRRWWERLMLFRGQSPAQVQAQPRTDQGHAALPSRAAASPRDGASRPAATVAGNAPC